MSGIPLISLFVFLDGIPKCYGSMEVLYHSILTTWYETIAQKQYAHDIPQNILLTRS